MLPRLWFVGSLSCVIALAPAPCMAAEPVIAGWIENAWLEGSAIKVRAKLDTGAKSSSINAPDRTLFSRGGEDWLRFRLSNIDGASIEIERRIIRHVRIRRAGADTETRPVIALTVCVAGQTAEAEFTVADRTGMDYQILIGRSFLAGTMLVDSGRTYLGSGRCTRP